MMYLFKVKWYDDYTDDYLIDNGMVDAADYGDAATKINNRFSDNVESMTLIPTHDDFYFCEDEFEFDGMVDRIHEN